MALSIQTFQENKSVITVAVGLYTLLTYFMQKILNFSFVQQCKYCGHVALYIDIICGAA